MISDVNSTSERPEDTSATLSGLVIRAFGKQFIVHTTSGDFTCSVRVNVKRDSKGDSAVVVGDEALLTPISETEGVIERILPRKTAFFRPEKGLSGRKQTLAANIEQLVIITSCAEPPLKPRLIDRFIVAGDIGGLEPLVVINKADLGVSDVVHELQRGYEQIHIPAIIVSAETGEGLERLKSLLVDRKSLFAGHSGVGKSTLLNGLMPGLNLKTAELSEYSNRGKHTTTRVELHKLPSGGFVLDSPGLKTLSLWEVEKKTLAQHFREFAQFLPQCRFSDCVHVSEPDCAVRTAAETGAIPMFRYESYVHIRETLRK